MPRPRDVPSNSNPASILMDDTQGTESNDLKTQAHPTKTSIKESAATIREYEAVEIASLNGELKCETDRLRAVDEGGTTGTGFGYKGSAPR
jgi:putative salt-induced outer membrane protein YdiY